MVSNKAYMKQLKIAIANDRNIARARKEIQTLPVQRQPDVLLDPTSNRTQAYSNLLSILGPERAEAFLVGQSDDDISKINVFWNDLKPALSTKIGLTKPLFERIVNRT